MHTQWEFLPATVQGFEFVKLVWLDVDGVCSVADADVRNKGNVCNLMARVWKATFASRILAVLNYMHDGGIR